MIIGKIDKNEKRKKFSIEITCSNCKAKVPGGMQASEKFYGTESFFKEMEDFRKNYLCGICRDKRRVSKSRDKC